MHPVLIQSLIGYNYQTKYPMSLESQGQSNELTTSFSCLWQAFRVSWAEATYRGSKHICKCHIAPAYMN
jgi:hypothetical protein